MARSSGAISSPRFRVDISHHGWLPTGNAEGVCGWVSLLLFAWFYPALGNLETPRGRLLDAGHAFQAVELTAAFSRSERAQVLFKSYALELAMLGHSKQAC